jgi:hypothetical protein
MRDHMGDAARSYNQNIFFHAANPPFVFLAKNFRFIYAAFKS